MSESEGKQGQMKERTNRHETRWRDQRRQLWCSRLVGHHIVKNHTEFEGEYKATLPSIFLSGF